MTHIHLVAGGYPAGETAGHDIDYARLHLLNIMQQHGDIRVSVSNDFAEVEKWLDISQMLVTYVAGPFLNEKQNAFVKSWLEKGGRWLAFQQEVEDQKDIWIIPVGGGAPLQFTTDEAADGGPFFSPD